MTLEGLPLLPPGLVVNRLRGDPAERRAHGWLGERLEGPLDAAFLGVPFDGASTVRPGSRFAPDAVRAALGLYTAWSVETGRDMSVLAAADVGDVDVVVTDKPATFARVTEVVRMLAAAGTRPVVIGGDHSIAFPTVSGLCEAFPGRRVGIVQFDAHHDLREAHFGAESSGVPFRRLLERWPDQVRGQGLVQIGIGEFCNAPAHAAYARERGVTVRSDVAVRRLGLARVVDEALAHLESRADLLWVSLDIDCVDQSQAPGTAAPNPAGLDARDLQDAVRRIAAHPCFAGIEIVEISPPFDVAGITANLGAALALNALMGIAEGGRRAADAAQNT
jgi:formimidoylglutamase